MLNLGINGYIFSTKTAENSMKKIHGKSLLLTYLNRRKQLPGLSCDQITETKNYV